MTNRRYGFYLRVLGSSFSAFSVLGLRVLCSLCLQGLINDVQKVFPDAEHRFCVRHLLQNFQRAGHRRETLKNDLWAIARSTHLPKWQKNMDKLQADSQTAYDWISELVPSTWIKAFSVNFPNVMCS